MEDRLGPKELAVTVLGLGYLPVAPGTWCSCGMAVLYLGLRMLPFPVTLVGGVLFFLVSVAAGFGLGVWATERYDSPDPSVFVLDEAAGFWLAALLFWHPDPLLATGGILIAFRFFDIVKCFPLRRLEKLRAPTGIMVDDLGAGLYAAAVLWFVRYIV
jgi:phosphatidylglycerophosphatase A